MEGEPIVQPKPSRFGRALLYFLLGLAALFAVSTYMGGSLVGGDDLAAEKIAVVEVAGFIGDSRDVIRQIRNFREDDSVRAIIVRIDSPGGAVAPSQEIYNEVLRSRPDKPIYVSMGSIAASGGYYIAAAAERVFANPGTLTGSIGVIMAFSNLEGLMEKVGVKPEVIKAGKYKDTGSPARAMSKKEKKYLEHVVDDVHQQFIEAVARGRDMTPDAARKISDGRIFTGRQALELNMVDELGGLEDVIASLGKRLGIDGRPRVVQERDRESFMEWFLRSQVPDSIKNASLATGQPALQFLWIP